MGQTSHPTCGFESQGVFTEASVSLGRVIASGSLGGQWTDIGFLTQEPGVAKLGSCSELLSTGRYFSFLLTEKTTLSKPETPLRPQRFSPFGLEYTVFTR